MVKRVYDNMEEEVTIEEQKELLRIARAAIAANFKGTQPPDPVIDGPRLKESRGAFVTLHDKDGSLRGCIGSFMAEKPLYKTVREMSLQAAFHDPRFLPLDEEELKEIHIEISVLSPLREVKDVDEIQVGRHGLYIIKGIHCGTLLPQVAVEYGWDRETFLEHTCMKAGLPCNSWKSGVGIFIYSAQVFSEESERA